jgi:phosphinothricin acetyltransferase
VKTIRLATPDDAAAAAEIYAAEVAETSVTFEDRPPGAEEMRARIVKTLGFAPWLVCVEGGLVTGYAYAAPHHERAAYRWSVDVSVYVRRAARREGVGRALYRSLLALLRLQGFCVAHACITVPNPASIGLHEAIGFRPVGLFPRVGWKHDAWHDVGYWQLELRDRQGPPPELVLGVEALGRLPGFAAALSAGSDPLPSAAPAPGR